MLSEFVLGLIFQMFAGFLGGLVVSRLVLILILILHYNVSPKAYVLVLAKWWSMDQLKELIKKFPSKDVAELLALAKLYGIKASAAGPYLNGYVLTRRPQARVTWLPAGNCKGTEYELSCIDCYEIAHLLEWVKEGCPLPEEITTN